MTARLTAAGVAVAVLVAAAAFVALVVLSPMGRIIAAVVVWTVVVFAAGWRAAWRFCEGRRLDTRLRGLRLVEEADLRTETGMDRAYVRGRTL